jgi:hypothetical protein
MPICGHQEIINQAMERYIAHALVFESGEMLRMMGSPKSRNETPNPRNMACIASIAIR